MASEKQRLTIRKMLRRVANVEMFDSVIGTGDDVADQIQGEIDALGGLDKLTSKQASNFIGSRIQLEEDEM